MTKLATYLPLLSRRLALIVAPLNRLFDRLYHSKYNPLYRSGTLAVGFLVVLIVTGLYLCFFYSVSRPYASIVEIQQQVWLGRWIRALHRYATDGALIAAFFHFIQLLVQGKTWGPRTLAWLSGVVLIGALLLSAWSGYVMVWDVHAQLLAFSGATLFQVFPFLRDVIGSAFNGSTPVNSSFFFMNLFLHVAVPLGMFFGLWIHTARLARTVWFPEKRVFIGSIIAFSLLAILWPAPLPSQADLLQVIGVVPVDIFSGFWLPLAKSSTPIYVLLFWGAVTLFTCSIPWWWRPSKNKLPGVSTVNQNTCSGCTQCVRDCPYEAITMTPRPDGRRLLASVSPTLCVSCGICAASCDDRAIGPPGRSAIEQLSACEEFVQSVNFSSPSQDLIVVPCERNGRMPQKLANRLAERTDVHFYPVECCGTVHSDVIETLLTRAAGVFLLGCPARNCVNRDGLVLISERIYNKRVPFLAREIERRRIAIDSAGDGEVENVIEYLDQFSKALKERSTAQKRQAAGSIILRTLATIIILALIASASQIELGTTPTNGVFRIGTRISGRAKQQCRALTEEEKQTIPKHMQRPEICETLYLNYLLNVYVDEKLVRSKEIHHSGARGDSPLFISEDIEVIPGEHTFSVTLEPTTKEYQADGSLDFSATIAVRAGRIYLLGYDPAEQKLSLRTSV